MIDGKLIYNNLQSLTNIERKAIDIYENGTIKEFRDYEPIIAEDDYWGQWEINMVKLLLKDFNLDGDYKNKIVVKQ